MINLNTNQIGTTLWWSRNFRHGSFRWCRRTPRAVSHSLRHDRQVSTFRYSYNSSSPSSVSFKFYLRDFSREPHWSLVWTHVDRQCQEFVECCKTVPFWKQESLIVLFLCLYPIKKVKCVQMINVLT